MTRLRSQDGSPAIDEAIGSSMRAPTYTPPPLPPLPPLARRLKATRPVVRLLAPWARSRIDNTFVVFGQSRSGSTLLVDLLNSHPDIDCRGEIYLHAPFVPLLLLDAIEHTSTAPVFGFKLQVHQLDGNLRLPDPSAFVHRLHRQGYGILYLRRTNVVRHVISDQIRRATGITHVRSDKPRDPAGTRGAMPIQVDVAAVLEHIRLREHYWTLAERILADLPHLTIEYERDLQDGDRHQAVMDGAFRFLNLTPVPVSTRMKRINTHDLRALIENFDELETGLRDTPWHDQLETP